MQLPAVKSSAVGQPLCSWYFQQDSLYPSEMFNFHNTNDLLNHSHYCVCPALLTSKHQVGIKHVRDLLREILVKEEEKNEQE